MASKRFNAFSRDSLGFYTYSWGKIKGKSHHDHQGRYCLGECQLPEEHARGPIALNIDEENIQSLSLDLRQQGSFDVQVITTGDNDDSDCSHTGIQLEVEINYVK